MFLPESAMGCAVADPEGEDRTPRSGTRVPRSIRKSTTKGFPGRGSENGRRTSEPELTYFEWSLDYDDPNDVPEEAYLDEDSYWESNPAYGIRIFREHFESEVRALDRRTVAVELFGVGDYPDPLGSDERPISIEQWEQCEQEDSVLVDPICIGFDV